MLINVNLWFYRANKVRRDNYIALVQTLIKRMLAIYSRHAPNNRHGSVRYGLPIKSDVLTVTLHYREIGRAHV